MLSLKSPKINVGVHCLKLRTKSMYINPVVDPDEAIALRRVRQLCVLVRLDPDGFRTRRRAGSSGSLLRRTRVLQTLMFASGAYLSWSRQRRVTLQRRNASVVQQHD